MELDLFAKKSTQNLLDSIEKSKSRELPRLIYALGIRHVGEHLAQVLARQFSSLDELASASEERLTAVNEIGPEVAASIRKFFSQPQNLQVIERLKKAGVRTSGRAAEHGGNELDGLTFVFTGGLDSMTRDEAKRLVQARGGRVSSSVSRKTDYVVVGEDPGSKLADAERLGVKTIREGEFRRMLGLE